MALKSNKSPMDVMDIWDPLSDPADELPLVIANHPRDVARTAEAQGEHEQKKGSQRTNRMEHTVVILGCDFGYKLP